MKPAFRANRPKYPRQWAELPVGGSLKSMIEESVNDISRQFFGYHLVKLGDLSSQLKLPSCPIQHRINITDWQAQDSSIVAKNSELPLSENSVDALILAHEMDFSQDPHQVLREVDRVLIPNGNLVIVGFNPFSLAGMFKYLPVNPRQVLHEARFFSSVRIKDWLSLLSFEVTEIQHTVFSELFFERRINPQGRWQVWCKKYMPVFSSVYIIVAKKRVKPLSLVKPKWNAKPNFSAVGASMRTRPLNLVKKICCK